MCEKQAGQSEEAMLGQGTNVLRLVEGGQADNSEAGERPLNTRELVAKSESERLVYNTTVLSGKVQVSRMGQIVAQTL